MFEKQPVINTINLNIFHIIQLYQSKPKLPVFFNQILQFKSHVSNFKKLPYTNREFQNWAPFVQIMFQIYNLQ